jgi:hypothetical protein
MTGDAKNTSRRIERRKMLDSSRIFLSPLRYCIMVWPN